MSKQPLCGETVLSTNGLIVGLGSQGFRLEVPAISGRSGEIIALIGGNATGKSTLLYTLATMHAPVDGTISYFVPDGHELKPYEFGARGHGLAGDSKLCGDFRNRHIGFGPQLPGLLSSLTLRENAALRTALGGWDAGSVDLLLERVGLREAVNQYPGVSSGGQVGRALLARALYGGPIVVILDESTSQVDARTAPDLLAMARAYARQGALVIFSCHDLHLAAAVADRFWLTVAQGGNGPAPLVFPFQDRDDPNCLDPWPDGTPRPILPPVNGCERSRAEVRTLADNLAAALSVYGRTAIPLAKEPPAPPSGGALPRRVVPRLATICRYAVRENMAPERRTARLAVLALVALAVACFASLRDLAQGVRANLDRKTPPHNPQINRIDAFASRPGRERPVITPDEIHQLKHKLAGLDSLSLIMERSSVEFHDAAGRTRKTTLVSYQPGDPHFAVVSPGERAQAPRGMIYLTSNPAPQPAAAVDQPVLFVPLRWLRKYYWRIGPDQPDGKYPTSIELSLGGVPIPESVQEDDPRMKGWRGIVSVPAVVVDFPDSVLRSDWKDDPNKLLASDGFLRRLTSWQTGWGFVLRGQGGIPLADDVPIVTEIRATIPGATSEWLKDNRIPRLASAPFAPVRTFEDGSELVLKLDPANRADHLMTESMARAVLADLVTEMKKIHAGDGELLAFQTVPSSALAPVLPPLPPGEYTRAELVFHNLGDVLPAEGVARQICPDLGFYVRYREAIEQFRAVRFIVDGGGILLEGAFVMALLFVVGMLAYLHAAAKTAETASLRVLGMPTRAAGRLFLAQLALLVLPACALGLALARAAAWAGNNFVARQIAPSAPGAAAAKVFASCQGQPLAGIIAVFAWSAIVLAACTCLSVRVAGGKSIAGDLQRGGY